VNTISCAAAGACVAAGGYKDGSANYQAFVVNSTPLCVVPRVVGKTLSAAKRILRAAHCGVGKTTRVYSKLKRGRVVAEKPRAGRHLKSGARVALTVSKGKRA
jgi:beta-lactam-binding protein with PASTA domain